MKKTAKRILSISIAIIMLITTNNITVFAESTPDTSDAQYEISVNGKTILAKENQKVVIGIESTTRTYKFPIQTFARKEVITGNVGTVTVWGSGSYFYWDIKMYVPATHFIGRVTACDLYSGFSCGTTRVSGFSGKCKCARPTRHLYRASLEGSAYLGLMIVGTVNFNSVTWVSE